MPTLALTGATGQLGRLVIDELLENGTPPASIVALVRDPQKAEDLAARGVVVREANDARMELERAEREADYARPETLEPALAGVDRLLLISSNVFGQRAEHHAGVVEAAERAGVGYLAYTSILNAERSTMLIAEEHQATEERLLASSIPTALLRNGWYTENHSAQAPTWLQHGGLTGAAGEGRWQPAARADYAAAAAAVLASEETEPRVYELAGDAEITMAQLAGIASEAAGRELSYTDLPEAELADVLVGAGLPVGMAKVLAESESGIKRGELTTATGELSRLIGRATTPVAETVRAAVAAA